MGKVIIENIFPCLIFSVDPEMETTIITGMYPAYMDMGVADIDFETRRTILTTLFTHLMMGLKELPIEVKEIVMAKMLEGNLSAVFSV